MGGTAPDKESVQANAGRTGSGHPPHPEPRHVVLYLITAPAVGSRVPVLEKLAVRQLYFNLVRSNRRPRLSSGHVDQG
jgi:hypothetical protein